ncbi:MAG: carbohydrate ABC transporter permease [Ktedonobacteraceae bacterium]|nr:carbohydrate ABC transporter permease [Ktedonobacteraceae bacterium]
MSPFDPNFIKLGTSNKILMMPAASWFGEYVFKASYKTPSGQLAVALPLKWEADSEPHAGAQGGAAWAISSHSKNPKAAADNELFSLPPLAFGSFENVAIAWGHLLQFNNNEILLWLGNSLLYSGGALILTILVTIPAGYALATMQFRGRYLLLMTTLIVMILPTAATVLPLFLVAHSDHLSLLSTLCRRRHFRRLSERLIVQLIFIDTVALVVY